MDGWIKEYGWIDRLIDWLIGGGPGYCEERRKLNLGTVVVEDTLILQRNPKKGDAEEEEEEEEERISYIQREKERERESHDLFRYWPLFFLPSSSSSSSLVFCFFALVLSGYCCFMLFTNKMKALPFTSLHSGQIFVVILPHVPFSHLVPLCFLT